MIVTWYGMMTGIFNSTMIMVELKILVLILRHNHAVVVD